MRHLILLPVLSLAIAGCGGGRLTADAFESSHGYSVQRGDVDVAQREFLSPEWRVERQRQLDFKLRHTRDNGIMWIQVLELKEEYLEMDPGVLTRNYVENLAGGHWWVRLDGTRVRGRDVRWATSLLDEHPALVAGQPAHLALIDVANVDQLQLDADARAARAVVALIRGNIYSTETRGDQARKSPLLMIVGYANAPGEFEQSLGDFERLLSSIRFPEES